MEYSIFRKRTAGPRDMALAGELKKQFSLDAVCADMLISRGIDTVDLAERFLRPSLKHLNDPFLFREMDRAVSRIQRAVREGENIVVFGDYDCDGVCASVILYKYLTSLGAKVTVRIPDRFSDGYGLGERAVGEIISLGAEVVITVDNGIAALDECAVLSSSGIDVIVTDHHLPKEKLPEAYAVIDPKTEGEEYPFTEICGATVALRLCEALGLENNTALYRELTVFDALATVADVVPLVDENRTIVSLGLGYLPNVHNPGLDALLKVSLLKASEVSASDISFRLAPRINAAGRLENAMEAFELFTAEDPTVARELAERLDRENTERREVEEDIIARCEKYINERSLTESEKILFIALEDAHEGVVGIAAGKVAEKYGRPAVVGSINGDTVKASARSIPEVNLYEMLSSASAYYTKFGGHSQAAGLTFLLKDMKAISSSVNGYAEASGIDSLLIKSVSYDTDEAGDMLTMQGTRDLEAFAPYGYGNPRPVILMEGVTFNSVRYIGSDGSHVKTGVTCSGRYFSAIAFGMADTFREMDLSASYDILFSPGINVFRGNEELQLEIKAVRENISCPDEYYFARYLHFTGAPPVGTGFVPPPGHISDITPETATDCFPDALFIVYGRETFMRLIRYSSYRGRKVSVSYGSEGEAGEGSLRILVCPRSGPGKNSGRIIVCDSPDYSDYDYDIYAGREDVTFLEGHGGEGTVRFERELVGSVYKKLPVLSALGGDWREYIRYLGSVCGFPVNVFLLRICLDILSELDIINYVIDSNTLEVEFLKVDRAVDLDSSATLRKISGAFVKEEDDGSKR